MLREEGDLTEPIHALGGHEIWTVSIYGLPGTMWRNDRSRGGCRPNREVFRLLVLLPGMALLFPAIAMTRPQPLSGTPLPASTPPWRYKAKPTPRTRTCRRMHRSVPDVATALVVNSDVDWADGTFQGCGDIDF